MKGDRFTRTACQAALAAGEILARHFNRKIRIDFKGTIDPVTDADRSSQKAIVALLRKRFPDHSVLGEENENEIRSSEYRWIIDPLDGTVNFIHGVPLFCVSIALVRGGRIHCGVVHAPLLRETFVSQQGIGAWCNGKRIHVSAQKKLIGSLAVTGFPYYVHEKPRQVMDNLSRVIVRVQGIRRLGSAALDLAYVAMGRFEAFWEEGLAAWDVAAGSLLVREAGGIVTDFSDGDDYLFGRSLIASNGQVHRKMLRLVQQQGKGTAL